MLQSSFIPDLSNAFQKAVILARGQLWHARTYEQADITKAEIKS